MTCVSGRTAAFTVRTGLELQVYHLEAIRSWSRHFWFSGPRFSPHQNLRNSPKLLFRFSKTNPSIHPLLLAAVLSNPEVVHFIRSRLFSRPQEEDCLGILCSPSCRTCLGTPSCRWKNPQQLKPTSAIKSASADFL